MTPLSGPRFLFSSLSYTTTRKRCSVYRDTKQSWHAVPHVVTAIARTRYVLCPLHPVHLLSRREASCELQKKQLQQQHRNHIRLPTSSTLPSPYTPSQNHCFFIPLTSQIAISQIPLQPRCPRSQDPHLRSRPQTRQCRRVPALRAHGLKRIRAVEFRSVGGRENLCE